MNITPKGIIICEWDNRLGIKVRAKYPEDIIDDFTDDDLLKIFATHALSGEPGILSMFMRSFSIDSYYAGKPKDESDSQFIVAFLLSENENPEDYEDYLSAIGESVINSVNIPGFQEYIIDCLEGASENKKLSEEQYFALFLRNDINKFVLKMLREGPLTKKELDKYLIKRFPNKMININKIILRLLNFKLIFKHSVDEGKKTAAEYLFLVKDMDILRSPGLNVLINLNKKQKSSKLTNFILLQMEQYFKSYTKTAEDSKVLIDLMSNPIIHEIIKVLRKEYIKSEELIYKIGFEIKNIEEHTQRLIEQKIVLPIKDSNKNIWLFLLCDIQVFSIFPEYLVDVIHQNWGKGVIEEEIALKHLDLLKSEYVLLNQIKGESKA